LSAQRAGQIAHALQSHAVAAHDCLIDLQRDLTQLAGHFPISESAAATAAKPAATGDVSGVRSSVAQELKAVEESLAKQLEEQLSQSFIVGQGGLRTAITAGGEIREKLLEAIRGGARQAALAKVQSLDLASVLLKSPDGESPLAKCVAEAQPWLERCGGRRRLIFVVPQQLVGQYSTANIAAQLGPTIFKQLPGIAPGTSSDLALLIELSDISVAHAAANLIDFRRDLAEAAGRLQTRSDIQWTPVFAF
jgi:hypothetical protein